MNLNWFNLIPNGNAFIREKKERKKSVNNPNLILNSREKGTLLTTAILVEDLNRS